MSDPEVEPSSPCVIAILNEHTCPAHENGLELNIGNANKNFIPPGRSSGMIQKLYGIEDLKV